MLSPLKPPRSLIEPEKHRFELTSWQLISLTIALLVGALGFFALGMIIERKQSSSPSVESVQKPYAAQQTARETAREGRVLSPHQPGQEAASNKAPASPPEARSRLDLPAPPSTPPLPDSSRERKSAPSASPPQRVSEPSTQTADPEPQPDTPLPPSELVQPEPVPPPRIPEAETRSLETPPSPASDEASGSLPIEREPKEPVVAVAPFSQEKALYAVQVAAVEAKDELWAKGFQKSVEEKTGLGTRLVLSDDGKFLRVLVGSFPDWKSAADASAELEKSYKGCFPRKL
jgi:hypothetical protein